MFSLLFCCLLLLFAGAPNTTSALAVTSSSSLPASFSGAATAAAGATGTRGRRMLDEEETDWESYIVSLFPPSTKNATLEQLTDAESPQSQALAWLVADPNLPTYDDAQVLQRFALAVFYYAANGPEWDNYGRGTQWLNYSRHECDWRDTFFAMEFPCLWIPAATNSSNATNTTDAEDETEEGSWDPVYRFLELSNDDLNGQVRLALVYCCWLLRFNESRHKANEYHLLWLICFLVASNGNVLVNVPGNCRIQLWGSQGNHSNLL
jgi:hypothetical protein